MCLCADSTSPHATATGSQTACMMLTLASRPTRYVEVWAKEPSEEGLSLGHLVADPDLLFVIPQGAGGGGGRAQGAYCPLLPRGLSRRQEAMRFV